MNHSDRILNYQIILLNQNLPLQKNFSLCTNFIFSFLSSPREKLKEKASILKKLSSLLFATSSILITSTLSLLIMKEKGKIKTLEDVIFQNPHVDSSPLIFIPSSAKIKICEEKNLIL